MPALTANSWTITFKKRSIYGGDRCTVATLALPGTDTYPDNGIPLPPLGKLGYVRNIDSLNVFGVDPTAGGVSDFVTKYDKTNHKLLLYASAAAGAVFGEAATSVVPGPRTWDVEIHGW